MQVGIAENYDKKNNNEETQNIKEKPHINEGKIFKYCQTIVNHPLKWFGIGFGIHLSFFLITLLFYFTDWVTVIVFAFDNIPMVDRSYKPYHCFMALEALRTYWFILGIDHSLMSKYGVVPTSEIVTIYYDSVDGNILNPKTIKYIYEFERNILNFFMTHKLCRTYFARCSGVQTLFDLGNIVDRTDPDFNHVQSRLARLMNTSYIAVRIKHVLSKDFTRRGKLNAKVLKTSVRLKYLPAKYIKYLVGNYSIFYDKYKPYFHLYYENQNLLAESLLLQVKKDSFLILGSIIFIYLFTWLQTRSMFVTFFAISSIFTSFFLANMIHTVLFRVKFFGIFHVLSIFLILGFGCDNIYVFFDCWKYLHAQHFPSLAERLTETYQMVGWSMLITSVTTAIAFFILIWTPLLTIFSFGLFVAILVLVNYVSVLIYLPSVVVVNHLYIAKSEEKHDTFFIITHFFKTYFFNFLQIRFMKYIILVIFFLIFLTGLVFLSGLKVAEHFPAIFVSWSTHGRMEYLKKKYFTSEQVDKHLKVALLMGVSKINVTHCPFWDYNCEIKLIFDEKFQINAPGIQEDYKHLCDSLVNADDNLKSELGLFNETGQNIKCIPYFMDNYFKTRHPNELFQIPWTQNNFLKLISLYPGLYGNYSSHLNFRNKFETALYFFLTDGYGFGFTGLMNYRRSSDLYFCILTKDSRSIVNSTDTFYGLALKVSVIDINITLYTRSTGFTKKKSVFKKWISWAKDREKKFTILVCGSQTDLSLNGYFHWIHIQEILTRTAILGVVLGLCCSFPIILLATRNFFTFGIIMLGTILSTISVMSTLPVLGWDLGLLESINITIIVGLTIDYLVHMGLAYNSSSGITREERTQEMLEDMGISILSGMLTTLGSAFFLFFCKTQFLYQFGIFVFITISCAGVYSILFLPCFFLAFGPIKPQGNLETIFFWRKK